MGEFTQNLLKLTEFPFSYSLIGLLALIFGQGINPDDLTFDRIGPLLILMGFIATTLSICDPVGALQRAVIKGEKAPLTNFKDAFDLTDMFVFEQMVSLIFPTGYLFAIAYTPDDIKKGLRINWKHLEEFFQRFDKGFGKEISENTKTTIPDELEKMGKDNLRQITVLLDDLKKQTVKTKWINAEVDRISALIYFLIIISLFIIAILFVPNFLPKFAQSFGYIEPINTGIRDYFQPINIGILMFSVISLIAIIYMLRLRFNGLNAKSLTVFKYLTALGAIKVDKEHFKVAMADIERYLNEDHWTLAEYWVNRIQLDYTELFFEKVTDKRPTDRRDKVVENK